MNQKKYFPYLDLLKFVCCIGIVGIHTWPLYYAAEPLRDWYMKICPTFVSIFFVVSSVLFWQKIGFDDNDRSKLGHFCKRLLILLGCWSIILAPHWISTFVRHNPNDWYVWLVPKILTVGTAQGSWFIMALIYGMIICYVLNRYLNKHLVFAICTFVWLYFSLVKGLYIPDYLGIYLQGTGDGFHLDSFYLPTRSIFWIEAAFYLVPMIARSKVSLQVMLTIVGGAILGVFILEEYTFVCNAVIAILLPAVCMRKSAADKNEHYVFLRKTSIIIYFVHFVFVTIFHVLLLKGKIGYEYGVIEFLIVLFLAFSIAIMIVKLSGKYRVLRYLY